MASLTRKTSTIILIFIVLAELLLIPIIKNAKKTLPKVELPQIIPTPRATKAPLPRKTTVEGIHNLDGSMQIIVEKQYQNANATMYSVFIENIDGSNKHLIFTKSENSGVTISAPANSWSPDNKYVFLEENASDGIHALVLKADGSLMKGDSQYLDAKLLFEQHVKNFTYDRATGWASPTLVIITTKKDGAKGPSYWFEMGSNAFLQLRS